MKSMSLKIEGIIEGAEKIREKIAVELSGHTGLAGAVEEIQRAARAAQKISQSSRRLLSLGRLPAAFLGLALLFFLVWAYWNFFYTPRVTIAFPRGDYTEENRQHFRKSGIVFDPVESSTDAIEHVSNGKADLALIQAGIPIHKTLNILQTPLSEVVLWMTRKGHEPTEPISVVLTNAENEGSHSVAKDFFRKWHLDQPVDFRYAWGKLGTLVEGSEVAESIPPEVDAVFVVVNVTDEANVAKVKFVLSQGFEFASPYIGAHRTHLRYPEEFRMPAGYIVQEPRIPDREILTYSVPNVLVARPGINSSTLAGLAKLFESDTLKLQSKQFEFNATEASEAFQGVDAFLGILINIFLGFLALLGLEMWVYRKRFHELNSSVSLLSMLQSNKDILGVTDPTLLSENLQYLSHVSDLLSMISAINGYYTQENSSLLFNKQSEVIHERCDNLKLNIQLKILHAGIRLEPLGSTPETPPSDVGEYKDPANPG